MSVIIALTNLAVIVGFAITAAASLAAGNDLFSSVLRAAGCAIAVLIVSRYLAKALGSSLEQKSNQTADDTR
ncbi:MAG: hypothetical protein ACP5R4_06800 [Armatimonadota bacterium]